MTQTLAACTGKSVSELFDQKNGDEKSARIVKAERISNGTVHITFRGVAGADGYLIQQISKPIDKSGTPTGGEATISDFATPKHLAGQMQYEVESDRIPFGGQFCYRLQYNKAGSGDKITLGEDFCLLNDQAWQFKGVTGVSADEIGRVSIAWDRLPVSGSTYEVFRRFPDKDPQFPASPTYSVVDVSKQIDEIVEGTFPRCYIVRVKHSLLTALDTNSNEICLDQEKYDADRRLTDDTEAPLFEGIQSIVAIKRSDMSVLDSMTSLASQLVSEPVQTLTGNTAPYLVKLSWKPAKDNLSRDNKISYYVYRATSSHGYRYDLPPYEKLAPGSYNFTDNALEKGKTYYYLVKAVDERGNIDQNLKEEKLPFDLTPPTFAGLVKGTTSRGMNTVKVTLQWDLAQDDKTQQAGMTYLIYRSENPGSLDLSPNKETYKVKAVTSYEDVGVQLDKVYYYVVRAMDEAGNIDENEEMKTVTTAETPPQFDGLDTVRLAKIKAILKWNPAQDDESATSKIKYRIYRRDIDGQFSFNSPLFETEQGMLQQEDSNIDPNKSYAYVVRAIDEMGYEDKNTVEKILPANQPPVFSGAPTVTWDKTKKCVKVNWTSATDDFTSASSMTYRIFRSSSPSINSFNLNGTPIDVLDDGVRTLFDCEADGQQTYSYVILAMDETEAVSAPSGVGTIPANQPPESGQLSSITITSSQSVLIKWTYGTDDRSKAEEIAYKLYRFVKPASGDPTPVRDFQATAPLASIDFGVREFVDTTGLSSSVEYSYVLRAIDEFGMESTNTNEFSLADNLPPSFNGLASVTLNAQNSATLTWPEATDDRTQASALTYKIYLKQAPDGTVAGDPITQATIDSVFQPANVVQTITGSVTSQTITLPNANKHYYFAVRVADDQGLLDTNINVKELPANAAPTFAGLDSTQVLANGTVKLIWLAAADDRDPSNTIIYRVYRLANSSTTATAADVKTLGGLYRTSELGATTLNDEAVNPATYTHYLVRAVDKDQLEDANTKVISIAPDAVNPVFLGIKTSSMELDRITLVWDPATDNRTSQALIKYKVYESLSSSLTSLLATTPIATLENGVLSYSRTPPTTQRHYYVVRAVDEAGNSDTNEVVKHTVDVIPPTFAGLVTGYAITNSSVQLFWTSIPNDDIKQIKIYKVENLTSPIASVNVRDSNGSWVSSFILTGLEVATNYTFIARASDVNGNEETNTVGINITTLANSSPNFAGLQSAQPLAGVAGMSGVKLRWSAAAGATHFVVYRVQGTSAVGEEFDFNPATCAAKWTSPTQAGCKKITSDVSEYNVTGLSQNTQYSFVVRAVIEDENGNRTGEELNRLIVPVTTFDVVAPTMPGVTSAAPAQGVSGLSTVLVKWNEPSLNGVYDGYRVLYKDMSALATNVTTFLIPANLNDDPEIQVKSVTDGLLKETTVAGLTTNKRYCFTVQSTYAANSAIKSTPLDSGFKCATPIAQPPEFAGVKGEVEKGQGGSAFSQFKVNWDPAVGSFTDYQVSISTVNDYVDEQNPGSFFAGGNTITYTARNTITHTFTGLMANTTYYVRVRARFVLASPEVLLTAGGQVSVQVMTSALAPSGDGLVSAEQQGDDQVVLKWSAPNNGGLFDRYYMFKATGPNADTDVLSYAGSVPANTPPYQAQPTQTWTSGSTFDTRQFVDTGLLPGQKVCYIVKAAFSSLEGFVGSSNTITKCVDVQIQPPNFAGVDSVTTPVAASGFTSLTAHWTAATGNFTKYQFAISSDPDPTNWQNIPGAITTTSFSITGLEPKTNYFVKIRALYSVSGEEFVAGEAKQVTGNTTPKAPEHPGLNLPELLENPGEIKLTWSAPNADPQIGGLYNMYLLWKWEGGSASTIMTSIEDLMSDGIISATESAASMNNITEVSSATTMMQYIGGNKLTENVQTCFLLRAAYRQGSNFVMSSNQAVKCLTPSASAPNFAGIATFEKILNSVNGFSQLKATWTKATGNFTRYEIAVTTAPNTNSWVPYAGRLTNVNDQMVTVSARDIENTASTALVAHQRYYARVRAIYQGSGGAIYAAGEGIELTETVTPQIPTNDGIVSIDASKLAGQAPSARITMKGNVSGFWDKFFIFRATNNDQSAAYDAVVTASNPKANMTGFTGVALDSVNRIGTSTSDVLYSDAGVTVGQWNCYIVRAGFQANGNFLSSVTAQSPVCVRPDYASISFSGISTTGNEVCDEPPCEPTHRWPNTGNSKIRLKFASVPSGDIDFYDVYMGSDNDATKLLAGGVYQSIMKADTDHDPDVEDQYLYVGGLPNSYIPKGKLFFLVRARCMGCPFVDTNTTVSNAVDTLEPYLVSNYDFIQTDPTKPYVTDVAGGGGQIEDTQAYGVFGLNVGKATLSQTTDFLRSSMPGQFAPRPNRTFAIKFEVTNSGDRQNVSGGAVFAADTSVRAQMVVGSNRIEGSNLGAAGGSTVFDERNNQCLWIGGFGANQFEYYTYPSGYYAYYNSHSGYYGPHLQRRMQTWDGQNLSEIFPRGDTPFPRTMPAVAFNPKSQRVMLFGGYDDTTLKADTWEWDGKNWHLVDAGPSENQYAAGQIGRTGAGTLAYDPVRQKMMLAGGRWPNLSVNKAIAHVYQTTRNDYIWHYTPGSGWASTPTPSGFPVGGNSYLVSVPSRNVVYFVSAEVSPTVKHNNIWKWDGSSFTEIAGSALPGTRYAYGGLYAFWEEDRQKLIVTFGYGNDGDKKILWEWSPDTNSWTLKQPEDAPNNSETAPCYDKARKQLVEYGGHSPNGLIQRSRLPGDVFLWDSLNSSWTSSPKLNLEPQSMGLMALFKKAFGIISFGGRSPLFPYYDEPVAYQAHVFKDGHWNRSTVPHEFRLPYNYNSSGSYNGWFPERLPTDDSVAGQEKAIQLKLSAWNDRTSAVGRGVPNVIAEFNGSAWTDQTISSTDYVFPTNLCPPGSSTNTTYNNNHANGYTTPHFDPGEQWTKLWTPWGIFVKPAYTRAYLPYDFTSTNPNCNAAPAWRYTKSKMMLIVNNGGVRSAKQVVDSDDGDWTVSNPWKFCAGTEPIANEFVRYQPLWHYDPNEQRILMLGWTEGAWSYYKKDIQIIKYRNGSDNANKCFEVHNATVTMPKTSWQTSRTSFHARYASYAETAVLDPVRNKVVYVSDYYSLNKGNDSYGAINTTGFVGEFDLTTLTWTHRNLPADFQKWTVINGNLGQQLVPIPGRPSEFLLTARTEAHTSRLMNEYYILKVTDDEITLKPQFSRFSLVLGDDRSTGYITMPGDKGDADGTYNGQPKFLGARSLGSSIIGSHTLFVVMNSGNTYDVYLDGNKVVNGATWNGASLGLYISEFIFGARYGIYAGYADNNERTWTGIGNTNVTIDWVKVFNKPLTVDEVGYWDSLPDTSPNP